MMSQRKKYSKEFKIDAINLVQEQGYSCSEAAKSLDIPYDLLNRWIRESKKLDNNEAFRGNGKLSAEQLKIRQLRCLSTDVGSVHVTVSKFNKR